MTQVFPVDDPSRVAELRRAAISMAGAQGLDETLAGNVALVATEICTNLLKHAKEGEVFLSALSGRTGAGVEILAVDRGPGMSDIPACLEDGYSSAQTSGTGLGAIARLSTEFDIYSQEERGTVLVARVQMPGFRPTHVGAVVKPLAGEELSGDAWAYRQDGDATILIVADGLGHGPMASRASAEAISAFRRSEERAVIPLLQKIHSALKPTRGAAVSVASMDHATSQVRYAGIGNIAGAVVGAGAARMMVSHNGTAGYHSPRFQEFVYPLPEAALVLMHSDGLHTGWNLDEYPGLRRRDPSVIAGVLYRDCSRRRDDVCVLIAKNRGAA